MLPQLFSIGQCVSGDVGTKSFVLPFADLGSGDPHPALWMLDGTDADEKGKQQEDRQPMAVHCGVWTVCGWFELIVFNGGCEKKVSTLVKSFKLETSSSKPFG